MPCPTTHGRQCPVRARPGDLRPVPHVPAKHLARQSPFHGPPGHLRSRGDLLEARRPDTDLPHTAVSARSHTFLQFTWHGNRHSRGLQGTSARAMFCRKNPDLPRTAVSARSHTFLQFTWHGNRHSTGLQGIFARPMAPICVHRARRTPPDSTPGHIGSRDGLPEARRPATHGPQSPVGARSHTFLQFIWHGNRHSRCFQCIFARAMALICVHRAPRTPPDIAPRHIRPRDDLPEALRTATHGRQRPVPHFPAIHLAWQSPF